MYVSVSKLSIGNLSTDVFEPRTATGSRKFSFLAWFCSLSWTGKLLFLCLRFDVTNVMASKRSKEGKILLPVDVHGSKTSVLKFPNRCFKSCGWQGWKWIAIWKSWATFFKLYRCVLEKSLKTSNSLVSIRKFTWYLPFTVKATCCAWKLEWKE